MKINLKKAKSYGKAFLLGGILVGATVLAGCQSTQPTNNVTTFTQEQLNQKVSDARADGVTEGRNSVNISSNDAEVAREAVEAYKNSTLSNEVVLTQSVLETCTSHTEDNYFAGSTVSLTLSDNDYCRLKDDSLEFNDKNYRYVDEITTTPDVKVAVSGLTEFDPDFGSEPRLSFEGRKSLSVVRTFKTLPDWTTVTTDNPITISVLGEDLEVTHVDTTTNSITINNGNQKTLVAGESFKGFTAVAVGDSAVHLIYTNSDNEVVEDFILEDKHSKKIGETKVYAEIFDADQNQVILTVGDKVKKTVKDGDAYFGQDEDKPEYVWHIDPKNGQFGVVLDVTLDDPETALKLGDKLVLPNGFGVITFKQMNDVERSNYDFSFSRNVDLNGTLSNTLTLHGDFEYDDSRDVSEVEWRNNTFYVYNSDTRNYQPVSNVYFKVNGKEVPTDLQIGGLSISVDVDAREITSLTYLGEDLSDHEQDVLTTEGFVIDNPKHAVDSGKLDLTGMPEEEVEYGVEISTPEEE